MLGLPLVLVKEVLRQVSELDIWWTLRASTDYGCKAPIERLYSQSLNQLSADIEPTDAKPWPNVDRFKALTDYISAQSLTEHLWVQSPDCMYSRRHLKSSQSLNQVRLTKAFSWADLIPYLNISQSYIIIARIKLVTYC